MSIMVIIGISTFWYLYNSIFRFPHETRAFDNTLRFLVWKLEFKELKIVREGIELKKVGLLSSTDV